MASAGTLTIDVQAGIASLQQDFQKVGAATESLGQRIQATTARMEQGFAGVSGKLTQLSGLLNTLGMGSAGTALSGAATAIETLGGALSTLGTAATSGGAGIAGLLTRVAALSSGVVGVAAALQSMGLGINRAGEAAQTAQTATASYDAAIARMGLSAESATERVERLAVAAANAAHAAQLLQNELALGEQLSARSTLPNRLGLAEGTLADRTDAVQRAEGRARRGGIGAREALPALRERQAEAQAAVEALRTEQTTLDARIAELQRGGRFGQNPGVIRSTQPFGPNLPTAPTRTGGGGGGAAQADQELQDVWRTIQGFSRDQERYEQNLATVADRTRALIDPTLQWRDAIEDVNAAQAEGFLTTEEAARATAHYQQQIDAAGDSFDAALGKGLGKGAAVVMKDFGEALNSIADGSKKAGDAMLEFAVKAVQSIAQIIVQLAALQAVKQAFTALGWTQMAAGIGAGGGGVGVQARMSGGPVSGGDPYLVGEAGPELFVPAVNGTIVPNSGGGGGAGRMSVVVNNNAPGVAVSASQTDERTISIAVDLARQQVAQDFRNSMRVGHGPFAEPLASGYAVRRRL